MAENNPFENESNTGHIWDDNLRELTNEPPGWWRLGFHASWMIVIVYCIAYPAIPWFGGATPGLMGWTSIGEYKEDLKEVVEKRAPYEAKIEKMDVKAILADNELSEYIERSGKVLFGDKCAACHGAGGAGNSSYPVLADNDWLWGGSVEKIQETITMGRRGNMPAKGGMPMSAEEIDKLATAIAAGKPAGEPLFLNKGCIACHGMDGKGMQMLGAANLTDQIFRFGDGSKESVALTITHGVNMPGDAQSRPAEMPEFGKTLSQADIKKLAVYVYKLGGGQEK